MINSDVSEFPFKLGVQTKKDVVPGYFTKVKQFAGENRWVIKEIKRLEIAGNFETFRDEVKSKDDWLKRYGKKILSFIPEHYLVYGKNDEGFETGYIVMRKVNGIDLLKMKKVPDRLVKQLENLLEAAVETLRESSVKEGWGDIPDLLPPQYDNSYRLGNMRWGRLEGENEEKLYLVDTYPLEGVFSSTRYSQQLNTAMKMFETEKGVLFSEGFIQKITEEIKKIGEEFNF